jgi:hypothetical protein
VEWVALVLLAAVVLTGAAALSGREDDRALGALVAKRIAGGPKELASAAAALPAAGAPDASTPDAPRRGAGPAAPAPPVPRGAAPPALRGAAPPPPASLAPRAPHAPAPPTPAPAPPGEAPRRLRGVSELAKRAWIACLGYRRWRYELEHPTAPNEALPLREALSIANTCLNPYDYFVEE